MNEDRKKEKEKVRQPFHNKDFSLHRPPPQTLCLGFPWELSFEVLPGPAPGKDRTPLASVCILWGSSQACSGGAFSSGLNHQKAGHQPPTNMSTSMAWKTITVNQINNAHLRK